MMQVITTHLSADFDSLASMIAASRLYPEAALVFSGSTEPNVAEFLKEAGWQNRFPRPSTIDLDRVDQLIVVDTQNPDRLGPFKELIDRKGVAVQILDHHTGEQQKFPGMKGTILHRGACTTVLFELLAERNLTVTPQEATLMLLGIYQDTCSLTSVGTTPEDFEAAAGLLRQGADLKKVTALLEVKLTAPQVAVFNELVKNLERVYPNGIPVGLATARTDEYVPDLAVVASRLQSLENLGALFVLVEEDKRVVIIGRSRLEEVDVGQLLEGFGGGGHPQAGSANVRDKTLVEVTEQMRHVLGSRVESPRRVEDLMHAPVLSVNANETLDATEKKMTRYNVNTLPVMKGSKTVGLVTRQMVEKALHHKLGRDPVDQIMSREFCSVTPEDPVTAVVAAVVGEKQTLVPVRNKSGQLVGVVSRGDLLRHLHMAETGVLSGGEPEIAPKLIKSLMKKRLPREVMGLFDKVIEQAREQSVLVYVVGGFVRDLLLEVPNLDIDLVVEGDGLRFARGLAKTLKAHVVSHKKFGTSVLVLPDGFRLDVATARAEYYRHPAALPTVEPGSIKLDLFRRDFTFNSMAIRLNGKAEYALVDFFNGQRDLKEKKVRVLHNLSFVEDPTRAFRAVRFEQRLEFSMGEQTEAFLRQAVQKKWIEKLSGHRLFNELKGMLREPHPLDCIRRMKELGLLETIHPKLLAGKKDARILDRVQGSLDLSSLVPSLKEPDRSSVYLLALVYGLDNAALRRVATRLQWTKKLREQVKLDLAFCRSVMKRAGRKADPEPPELFSLLEGATAEGLALLLAVAERDRVRRWVVQYGTLLRPAAQLNLTGEDLIRLGIKPGPVFQEVFHALREARLNGNIHTREEEESLVRQKFLE